MWLSNLAKGYAKSIIGRRKPGCSQTQSITIPETDKTVIETGLYEHFKGNRYCVFGTAIHSENDEVMVVYAPEHKRDELWVRPLDKFKEHVNTELGETPRFAYLSKIKS